MTKIKIIVYNILIIYRDCLFGEIVMIEYEELRLRLLESEKTVKNLKEALAIDTLKGDIAELEKESAKPDFWDDMENSQKVMQKIGSLKAKVQSYENVKNEFDDALVMIELANEEEDADLLEDCTSSVEEIEKKLESLTLSTRLTAKMHFLLSMPVQAEQRLRTGQKCFSECIIVGESATATRFQLSIISTVMLQVLRVQLFLLRVKMLTAILKAKWVFTVL